LPNVMDIFSNNGFSPNWIEMFAVEITKNSEFMGKKCVDPLMNRIE